MNVTKEEVIKAICDDLNRGLQYINAEDSLLQDKIIDVDLNNMTITIKFDFNVVESDNYIGLSFY